MKPIFHTPDLNDGKRTLKAILSLKIFIAQLHQWVILLIFAGLLAPVNYALAQKVTGAANLDQIRNGTATVPISPANWVNGNAGASNAHYLEGHSIGYRMVITNLKPGEHTVIIGYDIRDGGKNGIDYITQYQNLIPHAQFQHPAEIINPLIGFPALSPTAKTLPIPTPLGLSTKAQNSFAALAGVMSMFNSGTETPINKIKTVAYVTQGNTSAAHAETQLRIVFTTETPTVILAWGGHIASQVDWGAGTSAVNISGSPYHTRLISLDGTGGNQDRSLSAAAVIQPPVCSLAPVDPVCVGTITTHTAAATAGASYVWSIEGNGKLVSGPTAPTTDLSSPTPPSTSNTINVQATGAGAYKLTVVVTANGVPSAPCDVTVTVNAPRTANAGTDPVAQCYDAVNGNSFSLTGSGVGEPSWTVQTKPSELTVVIVNAATLSPTVAVSGSSSGGVVTLRLTMSGGAPCSPAFDDVDVTVNPLPGTPVLDKVNPTCAVSTGKVTVTSATTGLQFRLGGTGDFAAYPDGGWTVSPAAGGTTYTVEAKNPTTGCISALASIALNGPLATPDRPVVSIEEPSLCGAASPKLTVLCPETGTKYTVTQDAGGLSPDPITYDGINPVVFTLKAGFKFSIIAENASKCVSLPTNCGNYKDNQCRIVSPGGELKTSSTTSSALAKDILAEAYPNPTGRDATINFSVPKSGRVVVEVYNAIGSRVATLYDGEVKAGEQRSVVLKGDGLPSGNYTYRVITNGKTKSSRISLVK